MPVVTHFYLKRLGSCGTRLGYWRVPHISNPSNCKRTHIFAPRLSGITKVAESRAAVTGRAAICRLNLIDKGCGGRANRQRGVRRLEGPLDACDASGAVPTALRNPQRRAQGTCLTRGHWGIIARHERGPDAGNPASSNAQHIRPLVARPVASSRRLRAGKAACARFGQRGVAKCDAVPDSADGRPRVSPCG